MTAKDEKFEEFLKRMGLKLLPYQKEFLRQMLQNEVHRFVCEHCGCVFEACSDIYRIATIDEDETYAYCYCPKCGETSYSIDVEGEIIDENSRREKRSRG